MCQFSAFSNTFEFTYQKCLFTAHQRHQRPLLSDRQNCCTSPRSAPPDGMQHRDAREFTR